jgi:hypothetical protein
LSIIETYHYTIQNPALGKSSQMPYLPLGLELNGQLVNVNGLLDTGATLNVLPYQLGLQLGAVWERQTIQLTLSGNLARLEARAIAIQAHVGKFSPVTLGFAWTRSEHVPVILGQINFFDHFDICFHRSKGTFDVRLPE